MTSTSGLGRKSSSWLLASSSSLFGRHSSGHAALLLGRIGFILGSLEGRVDLRLNFRIYRPHRFRRHRRHLVKKLLSRRRTIERSHSVDVGLGEVPLIDGHHVVEHIVQRKILQEYLRLMIHAREFGVGNVRMPFFQLVAVERPHLCEQLLHHLCHLLAACHDIKELLDVLFRSCVRSNGNGGLRYADSYTHRQPQQPHGQQRLEFHKHSSPFIVYPCDLDRPCRYQITSTG